jgi:hypothetical protein
VVVKGMDLVTASMLRHIASIACVDTVAIHAVLQRFDVRIRPGTPVPWTRTHQDPASSAKRHKA